MLKPCFRWTCWSDKEYLDPERPPAIVGVIRSYPNFILSNVF